MKLFLGGDGPDPTRLRKAIAHFEKALTVFTETAHPRLWARTLVDLAYARWQLPGGDRPARLTAAKGCIDQAFRVLTASQSPKEWADAHNTRGLILSEWAAPGERAANVREAITHFEAAAEARLRLADHWDWAVVQNNLGRALHELPDPGQADNLRRAISCYEGALVVLRETWQQADRAMVLNNLGNALLALPICDGRVRAADLRRAAECYRAALAVHTEAAFPHHWALAQSNLGNVYFAQAEGGRDENLRAAIDCYEASLRVFTETADAFQWARVHDNLGIAYRGLRAGDRAANVERALACHRAALRVFTEDGNPLKWAQALTNLGFTHKSAAAPADDPDRPRRLAAECFARTLDLYTEAEFPVQRANALAYLGHQHRMMQAPDRQANIRQALAHYKEALRLRDLHGASGVEWAWNHVELANCHRDLAATGDECQRNLEHAVNHYAASTWLYRREAFPRQWASAQNQLGRAYHRLGTQTFGPDEEPSDREGNLRLAISAYEASLEVYHEQSGDALTWADVQVNLALCHHTLRTGDRRANLARARSGFDAVLRVRTRKRHPELWAVTHQTMGELCLQRRGWDAASSAAGAAGCFRKALTVHRGRAQSEAWAVLQTQLGLAHLQGAASGYAGRQSLRRATRCFQAALSVLTPADHPLRWAWTQRGLGRTYRMLAGGMQRMRDQAAYREKAADGFRAALVVYTAELYPAMHAGLRADLAAILLPPTGECLPPPAAR